MGKDELKQMPYCTVEQVLRFRSAAFEYIDELEKKLSQCHLAGIVPERPEKPYPSPAQKGLT